MERKQMLQNLPEKWAILRTPNNHKIVNEWANKKDPSGYTAYYEYVHSQKIKNSGAALVDDKIQADYTEITTEEFRVLVLGHKLSVTDLKENECIHVSTEEEDRQITELMKKANLDVPRNAYKSYYGQTVYRPAKGTFGSINGLAKEENWPVYPASYFITTNQPTMNKEIIGYKWKDGYEHYVGAAQAISYGSYKLAGNGTNMDKDCPAADDLGKAGVLELWFQPVYAPEKPKETIVTLGDKETKVTVRKGSIEAEGTKVPVNNLIQLQDKMNMKHRVANWDISIPSVKIGCCTFAKKEIDQIIDEYNKLDS